MPRWSPDAALRLEESAIALFELNGYQATTIPQIVERAGLTTRTFFRHFADKRDVLFLREREFPKVVGVSLLSASDKFGPRELVLHGLRAAGADLQALRMPIERRSRVIRNEPQLRERELLQYDRLSDAIRRALLERATEPREALVLGKLAALAFELSLEQWLQDPEETLIGIIDLTCAEIVPVGGSGPMCALPA
ncbi:TetR/AcrR family transcriptional regulator [Leifsonia aquatica]|uniref:TetR/AcrR family transcriptional regulator n=1 Tax=Leifsonia aquatica TaxID=144185 RepID=UPI00046A834E|nr:TetR/AcrR family transcriptional regulator [Leifsonia aquatica]